MKQVGDKYKIELEYDREDMCKLWSYEAYLKGKIKNNEKIPRIVLKKFLALLDKPDLVQKQKKTALVENAKGIALDYLRNSNQIFSIKKREPINKLGDPVFSFIPPPETMSGGEVHYMKNEVVKGKEYNIYVYSSTSFMQSFFSGLLYVENLEQKICTKESLIALATTELYHYLSHVPKKSKDFPSEYCQCIIIGYVLVGFGILNDEKTYLKSNSNLQFYTEYLYKSVLHLYKKQMKYFIDKDIQTKKKRK